MKIKSSIKTDIIILGVLVVIGFLIYVNALPNKFVWDDEEIIANPLLTSASNFSRIFSLGSFYTGGATSSSDAYYRPLLSLSFILNYKLWGLRTWGFHIFQISLHILTAILVFYLFRKLFSKFRLEKINLAAFLVSLLFLVHPANVEAVSYIAAVEEVLYSFFILLSFWFLLKTIENDKLPIQNKYLVLAFLSLFLGLLSKETAFVIFPLAGLYLYLFEKPSSAFLKKIFVGSGLVIGLYSFLRFFIAGVGFRGGLFQTPIAKASLFSKILTIPVEIISGLRTAFFPLQLAIDQQFVVNSPKDPRFWGFLLILIVIICLLGLLLKYSNWQNRKVYIFLAGWYLIGIAPTINLPLDMTFAERWLYFPLIGLISLIVVVLLKIAKGNLLKLILILFGIVLILFSFRTIWRNKDWKDGLTLYGHDIKYSPNNFDLENNYGVELYRQGQFDKAKQHLKKSIELNPFYPNSHSNLGVVFNDEGNADEAISEYKEAIKLGDYYHAYENLAVLLFWYRTKGVEERNEAREFLEEAFQKFPSNPTIAIPLAAIYTEDNKQSLALGVLESILQSGSGNSEVENLYQALARGQKIIFKGWSGSK